MTFRSKFGLLAFLLMAASSLAAQQTVVVPVIRDQAGLIKGAVPSILVDETGAYVAAGGGGGGGGAVTAAANSYALGSIIDLGTGASPGVNTVNGRLVTINTTLGSPYQAGGALPLPSGASTSAKQDSLLTALGSPYQAGGALPLPSGAATAANQSTIITALGSPLQASGTLATITNPVPLKGLAAGEQSLSNPIAVQLSIGSAGVSTGTSWASGTGSTKNAPFVYSYNYVLDSAGAGQPMPGNASGVVTQLALTSSRWQYAAASGGISNTTTAVTIASAAGGSLRNYITGVQIFSDALGAATEIAVRDGAAGTVLWRGKIGTGGITGGESVVFPVPLKGTANTLMEVVTLTASITGAVYFNAQGFTGL